ncbi:MAG: hypothetical protein ACRDAU_01190 [Clostridium sp.]
MDLDFLDTQYERMKKIGAYALLFRNSISKGTWKSYGFTEGHEQDNLIFSILLYIMEQSSKEEICTMDDIADFLDSLNEVHLKKELSYDELKNLATFIVNNVICDEGKAMYFKGYDFKEGDYKDINIAFVKSKMEEVDGVRRVSYYLTDQGYDLLLSTLEIEENLKITIQEIIFKEHLKKASYDKAVLDIKNIFDMYRRKILSMEEAIIRIRENPLSYSNDEYRKMTEGNIKFLNETKKKFKLHREKVEERIREFLEHNINIQELNKEENNNLTNLKIIKRYLNKVIDENQRILISHFDLKDAYGNELENIAKMSLIERFNFKREVYDKVLENLEKLEDIDIFLSPLFNLNPEKVYNLNKALEYQKTIKNKEVEEDSEISFDEDDFLEEENRRKLEKLEKYKKSVELILEFSFNRGEVTLSNINDFIKESETVLDRLIPSVEIFREIVIEFIKSGEIDINEAFKESRDFIENSEIEFRLIKNILEIIDENESYKKIKYIEASKILGAEEVKLKNVLSEEIRSSEEELLEERKETDNNYKDKEKELIACADEYKLEEKAYRNETYNRVKETEIKKRIKELEEKDKALNKEFNKVDKEIAIRATKIESLKYNLKEKCNKDEEKPKESLIEKNFKEETEKLKIEIKRLEPEKKDIKKEKEKLNSGLASLNEFNNLKIKEEVQISINIKTIGNETAILKRDLNNLKDKINKNSEKLREEMIEIEINSEFKDELFFKDTIKTLKGLNGEPKGFKGQLNKVLEAYNLMLEKLKVDIEIIKKEEEEIILNLLEYIEEIHINIGKIDENSTIEIKGRKLKMLNINILNFEEGREGYKLRLKGYVESIRDRALVALKKNENIEDIISSNITTIKLYDEVVGIGTVDIKLYKIEEDRQRKISWKEVSQNSGGEGFLSAFIILSSLLSYMRRDETSMFSKREEGKVLVMDNPFAQTNAAHLLKPLMDIAKKSNTQLICLTGLNGESIYNRFDNIYVLNLVSSRIKEGVKNLKSEHIKGEEERDLVASRFKIEEDQIKLF